MARGILVDPYSFDRIAEATRHVERSLRGTTGDVNLTPGGPGGGGWHPFINIFSETIPAWGVVTIADDVDAFDSKAVGGLYLATQPDTTFGRYAINGPTEVPTNKSGFLRFSGEALCLYEDPGFGFHPALGEGYGPKPGSFALAKGYPSLCVSHGSIKEDARLLQGTLSPITTLLGKTTGAITGGTSTTTAYDIRVGTSGSETDGGWTTVPGAISRVDIDDDKFVKLTWVNNGWIMEPLECNA
jgi:hypothetical protein